MQVTVVHVYVKPENVADFIQASHLNHEASVREAGNLRFDILQSDDDPCCFIFYEAYKTAEDAAAHKQTEHYLTWRETVAGWMAKPREGISYTGLYPVL